MKKTFKIILFSLLGTVSLMLFASCFSGAAKVFTDNAFHYDDEYAYDDYAENDLPTTDTSAADRSIQEVVYSTEYTNADDTQRQEMIGQALDTLYADGSLAAPAQYYESSKMYTFEYAGGVLGGFSFRNPNPEYNAQGDDLFVDRYSLTTGEEAVALIYNGFEESRREYYNELAHDWTKKGVPTYADHDVTVEDLKNIESCPIIVLSMHGSVYGDIPTIVPNETPNEIRDIYYKEELCINKSVAKITYESGNCYYEVLPWFFNQYYTDGYFDGSVIFSESCEFFGGNVSTYGKVNYFSDAFDSLSTEAVMGFYNKVNSLYSRNMMETTLEGIIFDGLTPVKAAEEACDEYGDSDGQEYPEQGKYPGELYVEGIGRDQVLFGEFTADLPADTEDPVPTEPPSAAPSYANEYAAYKALLDGSYWAELTASGAAGLSYEEYARDCLGYWLVWDIDKNGTEELIISSGWAQADFCITAFTYSDGNLYFLGSQYCGSGFAYGEPQQTGIVIKSYHGDGAVHYRLDTVDGTLRITQQMEYDQYDMNFVHHLTADGDWMELETHDLRDTSDLE